MTELHCTLPEDAHDYLPDGYELRILAYTGYDDPMQCHRGYVLARHHVSGEYATWAMSDWRQHQNAEDRERGISYAHGHYFEDIAEAQRDLSERFFNPNLREISGCISMGQWFKSWPH